MAYNHDDNLNELIANLQVTDGYNYANDKLNSYMEDMFQFCQTNLSTEQDQWAIQPARFYFCDDDSINACAMRRTSIDPAKIPDHFVIGIHKGLIKELHNFFAHAIRVTSSVGFEDFLQLQRQSGFPVAELIYTCALQFTYYHELGHLVQFSDLPSAGRPLAARKAAAAESYQLNAAHQPFDLEAHLMEFDADLYAGHFIALHLIDFWKRLPENERTLENLHLCLGIGVTASLSFFLFLMGDQDTMYYKASDHPHPLIRLLYIVDLFIQSAKNNVDPNLTFDPGFVLQRAFALSEALFLSATGRNRIKILADMFHKEKTQIEKYVNEVLIAGSKQTSYLVLTRMAGKA